MFAAKNLNLWPRAGCSRPAQGGRRHERSGQRRIDHLDARCLSGLEFAAQNGLQSVRLAKRRCLAFAPPPSWSCPGCDGSRHGEPCVSQATLCLTRLTRHDPYSIQPWFKNTGGSRDIHTGHGIQSPNSHRSRRRAHGQATTGRRWHKNWTWFICSCRRTGRPVRAYT